MTFVPASPDQRTCRKCQKSKVKGREAIQDILEEVIEQEMTTDECSMDAMEATQKQSIIGKQILWQRNSIFSIRFS